LLTTLHHPFLLNLCLPRKKKKKRKDVFPSSSLEERKREIDSSSIISLGEKKEEGRECPSNDLMIKKKREREGRGEGGDKKIKMNPIGSIPGRSVQGKRKEKGGEKSRRQRFPLDIIVKPRGGGEEGRGGGGGWSTANSSLPLSTKKKKRGGGRGEGERSEGAGRFPHAVFHCKREKKEGGGAMV